MGSTLFPITPPPQGGTPSLAQPGQPGPMGKDEFQSASLPNVTSFSFSGIGPPSALYLQRDDIILIAARSQMPAEIVTINARFLRVPEPQGGQPSDGGVGMTPGSVVTRGIVEPIQRTLQVNPPGTQTQLRIELAEGYLLALSVTTAVAIVRGQTFVRAAIIRPVAGSGFISQPLFSDYVMINSGAGWPAGRILGPEESTGYLHSVQQANPGAGNDWIYTVPGWLRQKIYSVQAQLAVANSGAARPVEFIIDDGVNVLARMATNVAAPINATANVNFSNAGTPSTSITSDLYAQMPSNLNLAPSFRIRSVTTSIVAGDAWTNIWLLTEDYITNV